MKFPIERNIALCSVKKYQLVLCPGIYCSRLVLSSISLWPVEQVQIRFYIDLNGFTIILLHHQPLILSPPTTNPDKIYGPCGIHWYRCICPDFPATNRTKIYSQYLPFSTPLLVLFPLYSILISTKLFFTIQESNFRPF